MMPPKLPNKRTWSVYRLWLRLPLLDNKVVDIRNERHKLVPRYKNERRKR